MELVIKIIQTALNVAFTLFLVNNVKDYIFLETHTKKQKKYQIVCLSVVRFCGLSERLILTELKFMNWNTSWKTS